MCDRCVPSPAAETVVARMAQLETRRTVINRALDARMIELQHLLHYELSFCNN